MSTHDPDRYIWWKDRRYKATPEYNAWRQLKNRCLNTNDRDYPRWGGRGITVCETWVQSFDVFLKDVGKRPAPDLSLDRIDNNKGYEPGNVHWATKKEQRRNTRDTKLTAADVAAIRATATPHREAAATYGVSASHVKNIRLGQFWQ